MKPLFRVRISIAGRQMTFTGRYRNGCEAISKALDLLGGFDALIHSISAKRLKEHMA